MFAPDQDKKEREVDETVELPDEDGGSSGNSENETGSLGDSEKVAGDKGSKSPNQFKRFFAGYWNKKVWTIPLTLLVIIGIMFALPATRYPILALQLKRQYSVAVFDSKTNSGISGAKVTLDGQTLTTNAKGAAIFHVKVGKGMLQVSKQYYASISKNIFVGVANKGTNAQVIRLDATGRQVPVKVLNKITGKPVENALVSVLDTSIKTDTDGKATIVLPASAPTQSATITADGFNNATGNIQVTSDEIAGNTFQLTPSERVYFLSNLNGNIDVVSTNLDGTSRTTVLAGTGHEDQRNTVLLASRDWKYLALLSKRDGAAGPKLYLINTTDNKLTTMESTSDYITLVGWSGHHFVYQANQQKVKPWQSGATKLVSYDADSGKNISLAQTTAQGIVGDYISNNFSTVNLVNDRVVYSFAWTSSIDPADTVSQYLAGKSASIFSISADGTNKKDLHDFPLLKNTTYSVINSSLYNPETLYLAFSSSQQQSSVYFEYRFDNNSLTQSNVITDASFSQAQRDNTTYLASPDNKQAFWAQQRDGKNTLFVGDYDGTNGKQIATLSDYTSYGWYTNDYLLVEKGGSELYVMPTSGGKALKISDYYKPPQNFYGYGGGYGGL